MRAFASKIELLTSAGDHLRYVPAELARAMIANASAEIASQNGKIRSIRLTQPASSHAERIGEPTGKWGAVPFSVREHLDCGAVVWKHHPRAIYLER